MSSSSRWCLVHDEDGHTYLIPAHKRADFLDMSKKISLYWSDPEKGNKAGFPSEFPSWAQLVSGQVTFTNPRVNGHPMTDERELPTSTPRDVVLRDIDDEREKQLEKWGDQRHDVYTFLSILGEEVGEAHKAALHTHFGGPEAGKLREELIQVAAVAVQIVEQLDRGVLSLIPRGAPRAFSDETFAALAKLPQPPDDDV